MRAEAFGGSSAHTTPEKLKRVSGAKARRGGLADSRRVFFGRITPPFHSPRHTGSLANDATSHITHHAAAVGERETSWVCKYGAERASEHVLSLLTPFGTDTPTARSYIVTRWRRRRPSRSPLSASAAASWPGHRRPRGGQQPSLVAFRGAVLRRRLCSAAVRVLHAANECCILRQC